MYNINFTINLHKIFNNLDSLRKNLRKLYKTKGKLARVIYCRKIKKSNLCAHINSSGKIIITGGKNEEKINDFFESFYQELLKSKIV